jgi:hypothetical protein
MLGTANEFGFDLTPPALTIYARKCLSRAISVDEPSARNHASREIANLHALCKVNVEFAVLSRPRSRE